MLFLLVVLGVLPSLASAINCQGRADGTYEVSCRSYAVCAGGTVTIHDCPIGQVYDNTTQQCKNSTDVHTICANYIDCTGKADQRYADQSTHCHTFYTCVADKFLGHSFCSSDLVFDEVKQTCNYRTEVPPPCGTKGSG